jgi:hypothetical protein
MQRIFISFVNFARTYNIEKNESLRTHSQVVDMYPHPSAEIYQESFKFLNFYKNKLTGPVCARTLYYVKDILKWTLSEFQSRKIYLYWLFPLITDKEVRRPGIQQEEIQIFKGNIHTNDDVHQNFNTILQHVLRLYGIVQNHENTTNIQYIHIPTVFKKTNWQHQLHTNDFKIMGRIITCLRTLGMGEYSNALYIYFTEDFAVHRQRISMTDTMLLGP